MAFLSLGQNRKAMMALDSATAALSHARKKLAAGDYQTALSFYNEALEFYGSEICGRLVQQGNISQQFWIEKTTEGIFGKTQASIALDRSRKAFELAEKLLRDVFTLKPDFAEAHEFMAELAIECGFPVNARYHLERLLVINPYHQRAHALLAAADFENGDYDEAMKKFAHLPETATTICYLARCHLRGGHLDEAIATLERGSSRFGQHYDCCYYLGCAYARAGRFEDARRVLGQMVRWIPRRAEPMIQLANVYLMSGWFEEAERFYKESLKLHPPDPTPAHYGLAMVATLTDSEDFDTHIQNIYRHRPNSEYLHCAWGVLHERAENVEEAARKYKLVPLDSPVGGAARARLGFMLYRAADYKGAKQALQIAAQLRPADRRVSELLGAAAVLTEDYETAVSAWGRIYGRDNKEPAPALKKALLNLTAERIRQGRPQDALKSLRAFYEKAADSDLGAVVAALAFNCAVDELKKDAPNPEHARELFAAGKAITQNSKFDYGQALADLIEKRYEQAAMKFRAVLAANARNPGASYHLGRALLLAGDLQSAENALHHGAAVAFNQPRKQLRLKTALAAVLVASARYQEALPLIKEILRGESAESPTALQAIDLKIRCLLLLGSRQSAERAAVKIATQGYVEAAELLLAAREIEAGRDAAALVHLENYLYSTQAEDVAGLPLRGKARDTLAELALRLASRKVQEECFAEAETVSTRALFLLEETNRHREALFTFSKALASKDRVKAESLAREHAAQGVTFVLESSDFLPSEKFIPVVFPNKQKVPTDILQSHTFRAADWDASSYPEPLITFDR